MVSRVSYLSPCSIIHEAAAEGVGEGLCYPNRCRIGTPACLLKKSGESMRLRICESSSSKSIPHSETVTLIRNSAGTEPSAGSWARKPDKY
jgi:hypothetical protein